MKLKYIGKDGSLGLKHGRWYSCDVFTTNDMIWVRWRIFDHGIWPVLYGSCPYVSFEAMLKNWEE